MAKFDVGIVIAFLNAKWGSGRQCPMCGTKSWSVQDSTFQVSELNPAGLVVGGPIIPVIPVICSNCGNTVLVNAITAGIVIPPPGGKQ